jgi:ABC-type lipoprotein export system ATPase subunit
MLELRSVFKSYSLKKGPEVVALHNVSLSFPNHGLIFILGKSGAGKSTLLNLVGGLDRPTKGEILLDGRSFKDFSAQDYDDYRNTVLGFVFQDYNLLDHLNVEGNIALALSLQGEKADFSQVEEVLKKVGLTGYEKRSVNELSGGQKQRVAIARALIKNPSILLADEPTGALDSETSTEILSLLRDLAKEKLVLVVSHDEEFAHQFGERIVTFKDGQVVSDFSKHGDTFLPTSLEKASSYEPLPLKKGVFPFKNVLEMAFSSMKGKPWKLASSLLLVSLSFSFLGLAFTCLRTNEVTLEEEAIRTSRMNALCFERTYSYLGRDGGVSTSSLSFSEKDKEDLEGRYGLSLEGYSPNQGSVRLIENYDDVDPAGKIYFSYYPIASAGLFPVDALPSSFSLLSGTLPQKDNEALITERQYEAFQSLGYSYYDPITNKKVSTPKEEITLSSILGKNLYGNSEEPVYTIVGVVDTSFPSSLFRSLKEFDDEKKESPSSLDGVKEYLNRLDNTGFHNLLFVPRSAIPVSPKNPLLSYHHLSGDALLSLDEGTAKYSFFEGYEKTEAIPLYFGSNLGSGECAVPLAAFSSFALTKEYSFSSDFVSRYQSVITEGNRLDGDEGNPTPYGQSLTTLEALVPSLTSFTSLSFAQAHLQEALDSSFPFRQYDPNFPSSPSKDEEERALVAYLRTTVMENPSLDALTESYATRYFTFYSSFLNAALTDVHLDPSTPIRATFFFENSEGKTQKSMLLKGFYIPTGERYVSSQGDGAILLSKDDSALFLSESDAVYPHLLGAFPKTAEGLHHLLQDNAGSYEGLDVKIRLTNKPLLDAHSMASSLSAYRILFSIAGGVLLFFAVILFSSTIASSISYKKREIGILRALGAHEKDVYWIFSFEAILLAFLSAVLSSILTFVVSFSLNQYFAAMGSGPHFVSFLHPDALVVLALLGVGLLTAFLASAIPALKIAKKEPVEAIRSLS